jgi:PAS domain S-box-containing protein
MENHLWPRAAGRPYATSGAILEINRDITERKQAEESLRIASFYTRTLIEASLDPLVTISREGKITDVNQATENITGLARDQLIGRDFCSYFSDPEHARTGYERVFAQGSVRDYPLAVRHTSSGHLTSVLYNATIFRNENGEVEGVLPQRGTLRNASGRRKKSGN